MNKFIDLKCDFCKKSEAELFTNCHCKFCEYCFKFNCINKLKDKTSIDSCFSCKRQIEDFEIQSLKKFTKIQKAMVIINIKNQKEFNEFAQEQIEKNSYLIKSKVDCTNDLNQKNTYLLKILEFYISKNNLSKHII